MKKEPLLMTPGPTNIPQNVLEAMARPMIHHRTPGFSETFAKLSSNLQKIFQTKQHVFTVASSGTGALEAAIVNCFSQGDKLLVGSIGVFGDRVAKIAEKNGLLVEKISKNWGEVLHPEEVKEKLQRDSSIKGVFVTHNETSTGVTNDIRAIGEVVNQFDLLYLVDAVSSLGALELKMDDWNIDVVVTGSQKALMGPSGLSFGALSEKAWEYYERATLPKFYFDFGLYKKSMDKKQPDTPFTPAISTVLAMEAATELLLTEGLEAAFERHKRLGRACRQGVKALGLEFFAEEQNCSDVITPVKAPSNIDIEKVRKIMRDRFNIFTAGGQQHLKGQLLRIGHMGYVNELDLVSVFVALEYALQYCGYPVELGVSVKEVTQALFQ